MNKLMSPEEMRFIEEGSYNELISTKKRTVIEDLIGSEDCNESDLQDWINIAQS